MPQAWAHNQKVSRIEAVSMGAVAKGQCVQWGEPGREQPSDQQQRGSAGRRKGSQRMRPSGSGASGEGSGGRRPPPGQSRRCSRKERGVDGSVLLCSRGQSDGNAEVTVRCSKEEAVGCTGGNSFGGRRGHVLKGGGSWEGGRCGGNRRA